MLQVKFIFVSNFFSTQVIITYHLIGYFTTYHGNNLGFNVEDSQSTLSISYQLPVARLALHVISPLYTSFPCLFQTFFVCCFQAQFERNEDKLLVIFGKLAMTGILTLCTLLLFRVMDRVFVSGRVNARSQRSLRQQTLPANGQQLIHFHVLSSSFVFLVRQGVI